MFLNPEKFKNKYNSIKILVFVNKQQWYTSSHFSSRSLDHTVAK